MDRAKSKSSSAPRDGAGPVAGPGAREWLLPGVFAVLTLLVLIPGLFVLDEGQLYPVKSDSAKYDAAAAGMSHFVDELPSALPKLFAGEFTVQDRAHYDWDSGILQHAASYVVPLGITYAWFGHHERAGRILTASMTAATAALLVLWTGLHFGRLASVIAGIAFVLWPAHVHFGTAIMTEMPMVFWILLSIVALERTRRSAPLFVALGGALLAVGVLVKISLHYLVVPFLLVDLLERGGGGRFRFLALRAAGALAVVALWGGFLRAADLPPGGVVSGFETELFLFRGNYPEDRGFESVGLGDVNVPLLLEAVRANPETKGLDNDDERMARIYRQALGRVIRDEPSRWAALIMAKAGWFWRWPGAAYDVSAWFGALPPPSRVQILAVAAGLLGLGVAFVRGSVGLLPAVLLVYLTLLHAGTHLVSRYNIPALALFLPYAGGGIACLFVAVRQLFFRARRTPPGEMNGDPALPASGGESLAEAQGSSRPGLADAWSSVSAPERVAIVTTLGFVVLTLAFPRDVWISLGLPPVPARGAHEFTNFGAFLAFGILLFLRVRGSGIRPVRAALVGILPVFWGLALLGDAHADRDGDAWGARLSRPGDRIVQTLRLPEDMNVRAVRAAEISIDMMEDAGTRPEVIVRVNGTPVGHFSEGLENPNEDYLLDKAVHAVQDRYLRIEKAYQNRLEEYVLRRHPDADLSYFRQWFRIPVRVDSVQAGQEVVIEIELVDGHGGGVTVFGDAEIDREGMKHGVSRKIDVPAFLQNPYELSTYQFVLFGTDRMKADVRFTRPLGLYSASAEGAFLRDGKPLGKDLSPARGLQRGEYRVRFRTQLHGYYVRRKRGDRTTPTWAVFPSADEHPVSADVLRVLSARRDSFFGGWRSY